MDLNLQDQVAVIVGAASGIGLATANEFAAEGVRVWGVDIDSRIEAVMREVPQAIAFKPTRPTQVEFRRLRTLWFPRRKRAITLLSLPAVHLENLDFRFGIWIQEIGIVSWM